jgi:excisionase family DNA binding protein
MKEEATSVPTQRRLLTIPQAADLLSVTENAVRIMIHRKKLPVVRLSRRAVRIDMLDLDAYIGERTNI